MQRRTTTRQLQQAIRNNLLHIASAEKHNKTTHKIDMISPETFNDSLDFLCETVFSDTIGWHYGWDHETGQYVAECSRMNPHSDSIIIAHLCANEGAQNEDIEQALLFLED